MSKNTAEGTHHSEGRAKKPYIGMSMEGRLATWYATTTGKDMAEFERLARELAAGLPSGARVLEVAPGPGFLSVALAKLGPYEVTGVDISESFVRMATEYARKEGVKVRFIYGSASDLPLEAGSVDLVVCRAAFKNFSEPLRAIHEMHRVLKPGGQALIIDLCKDSSWTEIVACVDKLKLSRTSAWMTKWTFKHMLLKRAHTEESMRALAAASDFGACAITRNAVGMEVRLRRTMVAAQVA
jgi:ubiquinone/menaquinone biosynthesis C-methylase UbiE